MTGYLYGERPAPLGTEGLWSGVFASTPASVNAKAEISIPGFTDTLSWGLAGWIPRVQPAVVDVAEGAEAAHNVTVAQVVLPARGDPCLVAFDDNGDPCVVWWEPA